MKRLLAYLFLVLVLTFSFQSWTNAEDISEFEIEGVSIGDNLLDHFSKEEIDLFYISFGPDHNGIEVDSTDKNISNYYPLIKYDALQISYVIDKTNFFRVTGMSAGIYYDNDIKTCFKNRDEIKPDIESLLGSAITRKEDDERKHWADKSGKSYTYGTNYYMSNGGAITVDCFDWSEEMKFRDHLRITFYSSEHMKLVNNHYLN